MVKVDEKIICMMELEWDIADLQHSDMLNHQEDNWNEILLMIHLFSPKLLPITEQSKHKGTRKLPVKAEN